MAHAKRIDAFNIDSANMKNNVIIVYSCHPPVFGHHEGCVLKRYPVLFIENYDQFSDFTGTRISSIRLADVFRTTASRRCSILARSLGIDDKKKSYIHLSVGVHSRRACDRISQLLALQMTNIHEKLLRKGRCYRHIGKSLCFSLLYLRRASFPETGIPFLNFLAFLGRIRNFITLKSSKFNIFTTKVEKLFFISTIYIFLNNIP